MIAGSLAEGAHRDWIARRETEIKERLIQLIDSEYPGYIWTLKVELRGKDTGVGVALHALMPANTWEIVPGRYLCTENDVRKNIIGAASRILEKYKIPRSSMRWAEVPFMEARAKADVFNLRKKATVPT